MKVCSKNQQQIKEICDGVLRGEGVGVFTYQKLKRLMEDENLRDLACARLNLGLDKKHNTEDEQLEDIVCAITDH